MAVMVLFAAASVICAVFARFFKECLRNACHQGMGLSKHKDMHGFQAVLHNAHGDFYQQRNDDDQR